jgi:hypothetical protein
MNLAERLRAALAGRYEIEREIGRGGMAVVYLARDLRLERRVAVKVLRPELLSSTGDERFLREIDIVSHLQHPNLVPLYDVGGAGGLLYYVMPFVEGESLRSRIERDGPLPEDEALRITGEIADALEYAHERGILHRDIKPGNVLLSSGHAQVADFGIARALSAARRGQLTEPGLVIGTPEYMSPEQAAGAAAIDARSDQYALACVCFEMLAGRPPFIGTDPGSVIARQITEAPPSVLKLRPTLPPRVEKALATALAKAPGARFATVAQFARALTADRRPGWLPAGRRWKIALRVAGATAVLVLAVPLIPVIRDHLVGPPHPAEVPGVGLAVMAVGDQTSGEGNGGAALDRVVASHLAVFDDVRVQDATDVDGAGPLVPGSRELQRAARRSGWDYVVEVERIGGAQPGEVSLRAVNMRTGAQVFQRIARAGGTPERAAASLALAALQAIAEDADLDVGIRLDVLTVTSSAAAVEAMVQAQRRLLREDDEGAAAALDSAVAADPGLLLAYDRRAVVEEWRHLWPRRALDFVEAGLEQSGGAPSRWTALLEAQRYFSLSLADSAIRAFHLIRSDHPDDVDAWLGYAEALYHFGPFVGSGGQEALEALRMVDSLGGGYPTILRHLHDLAVIRGDSAAAARSNAAMAARSLDHTAQSVMDALRFGNEPHRRAAWQVLREAVRDDVSRAVALFAVGLGNLPLADSIAGVLLVEGRTPEDRVRGAQYRLVLLAAMGRWDDGVEVWRGGVAGDGFDPWMMQAALAGYPATRWAQPMVARAWEEVRNGRAPDFNLAQYETPRGEFRALVHWVTLHGDSTEVRSLLRAIERARGSVQGCDPLPAALDASLRARLALLAADTASAIPLLEASATRPVWYHLAYYPTISMAPQRFLLAELYAARGDPAAARRWLRSFAEAGAIADVLYTPRIRALQAKLGGSRPD